MHFAIENSMNFYRDTRVNVFSLPTQYWKLQSYQTWKLKTIVKTFLDCSLLSERGDRSSFIEIYWFLLTTNINVKENYEDI